MFQEISMANLHLAMHEAHTYVADYKGDLTEVQKQIVYNEKIGNAILSVEDSKENRSLLARFHHGLSTALSESPSAQSVPALLALSAVKGILDQLIKYPTGGDTFGPYVSAFRIQFIINETKAPAQKANHKKIAEPAGSKPKPRIDDFTPGNTGAF